MSQPKPKLTLAQAQKAMTWFCNALGICDWDFELEVGSERPNWVQGMPDNAYGWVHPFRSYKSCKIWINLPMHKDGSDPIGTLFHEGMHVVASDLDMVDDEKGPAEYTWTRLGDILAKTYRAGVKV